MKIPITTACYFFVQQHRSEVKYSDHINGL